MTELVKNDYFDDQGSTGINLEVSTTEDGLIRIGEEGNTNWAIYLHPKAGHELLNAIFKCMCLCELQNYKKNNPELELE